MSYTKEVRFNNQSLKFEIQSDADDSVCNEIFTEHEYRIIEADIKNAKKPILDIGGHKGMFSIYAATINIDAHIYTFEPEENNYQALKAHIKQNHCGNIRPKNLAVAAKEGQRILHINADSHNHSFIKETDSQKKVQATTLAKILEKTGPCDIAKIDAEGAEYEIIENTSAEDLRKIKTFYIEYHKYDKTHNEHQLKYLFEKAGFKVKIHPSSFDSSMGFIHAIIR